MHRERSRRYFVRQSLSYILSRILYCNWYIRWNYPESKLKHSDNSHRYHAVCVCVWPDVRSAWCPLSCDWRSIKLSLLCQNRVPYVIYGPYTHTQLAWNIIFIFPTNVMLIVSVHTSYLYHPEWSSAMTSHTWPAVTFDSKLLIQKFWKLTRTSNIQSR